MINVLLLIFKATLMPNNVLPAPQGKIMTPEWPTFIS